LTECPLSDPTRHVRRNSRRRTDAAPRPIPPDAQDDIPLLIDFATPSSIFREHNRISTLRIIGNGQPGTFVRFPNGLRVSLPTDQIVFADDTGGHARVGFGGMQFVGSEEGQLVVRENSRAAPGGSALARSESYDAVRSAAGGSVVWIETCPRRNWI
jgi:hypothetical protein